MDDYVAQDEAPRSARDDRDEDVGAATMAGVFRITDAMWERIAPFDRGACEHASVRWRATTGA